ncbi:amino acid transporter [Striga asiatica]|uniref:Amino acid transporter n=1 Tax=Striga asiatica TaxID=4170 RepID=A0A5A7P2K7_STRAF|nr:amino acid transporter [Striga asiatica]
MGGAPQGDGPLGEIRRENDAGASFVLQSKGEWWHAGFHLTTAIVGPTILTLPYAFRGLGWVLGFICLTAMGAVTFYSYYLMSLVLDHCEKGGRRHIRFRELAADVLDSNKHWHQRRSYFACRAMPPGISRNAPPRDYSLEASNSSRLFNAFNSISILAAIFGNGILPEIQATLAPPATGKMVKGLIMCYGVIFVTFYSSAVSGYWVFGNKSNSNILKSFMPDEGPSLAPVWVLGLAIIFVLLQLFAIGLVYSQVAYEIIEKKSADVNQGIFSKRNLIPRIIFRSLYVTFCGFVAAMLPFFGDINAVVGAFGFIPLDFVLPMLLYNMTYKPTKMSLAYWVNNTIIVVFTFVGLMGAFSSTRKLVLDAKEFKLFSSNVVE